MLILYNAPEELAKYSSKKPYHTTKTPFSRTDLENEGNIV
jgi:hypothetical protein